MVLKLFFLDLMAFLLHINFRPEQIPKVSIYITTLLTQGLMWCPQVEEEEPDMPHPKVARRCGQTEVARRSPLQATSHSSSSSVHDEPSSSQALAEQGMSVASLQVNTLQVLRNPRPR